MKCDFCGHEVERGTTECPYCHYQFKVDAEVLSQDERDSFEGVTIEEDGSTSSAEYQEGEETREEYDPHHHFGQQPSEEEQQSSYGNGIHFHSFGGWGCLLWLFLILLLIVLIIVGMVRLFVAFPVLGVIALIWWLNKSYNWF